jgi:hypothetical protein
LLANISLVLALAGYLLGRRSVAPIYTTLHTPLTPAPTAHKPVRNLRRLRLRLLGGLWISFLILVWAVLSRRPAPDAPGHPLVTAPLVSPTPVPTPLPGALLYQVAWPEDSDHAAQGDGWSGGADWWIKAGLLTNDGVIRDGTEIF